MNRRTRRRYAAIQRMVAAKPGKVVLLEVHHDGWCPALTKPLGTMDDCTCEPEFVLRPISPPSRPGED